MKEQHRKVPFPLWNVHQTYRCLEQSCMRTDTQWQYYMITKVIKNASSQNVTCTKFRCLWLCTWKVSQVFSLLGKTSFSMVQWLCMHVIQFLPHRYKWFKWSFKAMITLHFCGLQTIPKHLCFSSLNIGLSVARQGLTLVHVWSLPCSAILPVRDPPSFSCPI